MQQWLDQQMGQQIPPAIDQQIDQQFVRARRQARVRTLWGWLRHQPTRLLLLSEVQTRLVLAGQHDHGLQAVPLDRIVGSEGRTEDFDRAFLPRHDRVRKRWARIDRVWYEQGHLPPVDLVQVGDLYFVRDGNHRVSVARQNDQDTIAAHVVELATNVPLSTDLDPADLEEKAAQSHFVADIHLLEARPGAVVPLRASDPATYAALRRHIDGHRYFMGLDQGRAITDADAVAHWYDAVYLPQVEAMRALHTCAAFPHRTETNVFLSIMEHRHYLTERAGHDPGPTGVVLEYMAQYGPWCRRWRTGRWGRIARAVRAWLRGWRHQLWARLRWA
jgi:hypothetical protein